MYNKEKILKRKLKLAEKRIKLLEEDRERLFHEFLTEIKRLEKYNHGLQVFIAKKGYETSQLVDVRGGPPITDSDK